MLHLDANISANKSLNHILGNSPEPTWNLVVMQIPINFIYGRQNKSTVFLTWASSSRPPASRHPALSLINSIFLLLVDF